MITQDTINWLTNNVHDGDTTSLSTNKPKFIKMYRKTKSDMIWYKSIKNSVDGTEILIPAKPKEIKFWKLK